MAVYELGGQVRNFGPGDEGGTIFLGQPRVGYHWRPLNLTIRAARAGDWNAEINAEIKVGYRVVYRINYVPPAAKTPTTEHIFTEIFPGEVIALSGQDITARIWVIDSLFTNWTYQAQAQVEQVKGLPG